MTSEKIMLASELFAISKSSQCVGKHECHWCGAACSDLFVHDDEIPAIGTNVKKHAKRPGTHWVCMGCYLWSHKRITVRFLNNKELKDNQQHKKHSWWITAEGAWAIRPQDFDVLRKNLIDPPGRFVLAFLEQKQDNLLQLMQCNDNKEIKADTELFFTVDGVIMSYCIYDLEDSILTGEINGKSAGVRYLMQKLNWPPPPEKGPRGPGRPPKITVKDPKKLIKTIEDDE